MWKHRRFVAPAAAVLAVLALCFHVAVAASEKKLYPACGGSEFTASASSQRESTLYTFPGTHRGLSLDCLAYEVISVTGGQKNKKKDYCLIEHQTEYAYTLVMRATYVDASNRRVTREFSIRDMTGGSLAEVTARMPADSTFSIVFRNLGTSERCNLKIRALLTVSAAPSATYAVVPTVVAVEPRTIFTETPTRTYLVLDHANGAAPSRADEVTLVDYTLGTCAKPVGDVITMSYASTLPSTVHMPGNQSGYSARTATFYTPNTYRVCFRAFGNATAIQVAVVNAYSGNPSYYEVVSGLDGEGRVMVGDKATIKFYGYDLDTRKDGDAAKFVWFTEECDSGKPAAGVPLADDLEPEDNFGPNTTYSLWTWTMSQGGAFKVCYRRKASGKWTEVPSIDDVGPGTGTPAPTSTSVPDPTDPGTKEKCHKLTYDPQNPWPKYKSVQITLTTKTIPDKFFATLSEMLCLQTNMFVVTHSRKNTAGNKDVFLALNCDVTEGKAVCDTTERLNYFAQMPAADLQEHGIATVVGSTTMFAFDDDNLVTVVVRRSSTVLVFCSLCVLGGGALAVLAVSRYKERRHHFTQFGLDEDDIDDMYDFGAAAPPNARNHYDVADGAQPAPRIHNAVIEMEE